MTSPNNANPATPLDLISVSFGITGGHPDGWVDGPDFIWPVLDLRFLDAGFDKASARILISVPQKRNLERPSGSVLEEFRANAAAALSAAAALVGSMTVPELEALNPVEPSNPRA